MAKPRYGASTRAPGGKKTVLSAGSDPSSNAWARKGAFLVRHYSPNAPGALQKNGEPTARAEAAARWGEPIPKNDKDRAKLYQKGQRMLERHKKAKESK
jgi:hypothetical protein